MIKNKVSIIVPVYNVEKHLEQCVNSILAQTYKNIEVILVDDGSPDNCGTICDNYIIKDPRIRVVHKKNGGLSSARNTGLDVATGEYIMFIDSDDFIETDMVEVLFELKATSNADIACCGMYRYKETSTTLIDNTISKNEIEILDRITSLKRLILRTIDCSSCNKLYHRELIGETRFKEGRNNEDHPFLFELYQKCDSIAYTNKAYYYYRATEGSITNSLNEKSFDIFKNTDDIERIIKEKRLDLTKEFRLSKIYISILFARIIQKAGKEKEYHSEYKEFIKTIKSNILIILFNKYFSFKQKLVAIYLIII